MILRQAFTKYKVHKVVLKLGDTTLLGTGQVITTKMEKSSIFQYIFSCKKF